jgi:hypothetical protein
MYCPFCKNQLDKDSTQCGVCGWKKLKDSVNKDTKKKRKNKNRRDKALNRLYRLEKELRNNN